MVDVCARLKVGQSMSVSIIVLSVSNSAMVINLVARFASHACAFILAVVLVTIPANAEVPVEEDDYYLIDENGVDLMTASLKRSWVLGAGDHQFVVARSFGLSAPKWKHSQRVQAHYIPSSGRGDAPQWMIIDGFQTHMFRDNGSVGISEDGDGATLIETASEVIFTSKHGIEIRFPYFTAQVGGQYRLATKKTWPNGLVAKFYNRTYSVCIPSSNCLATSVYARPQGVEFSDGFFLKFSYGSDNVPVHGDSEFTRLDRVDFGNLAFAFCDVSADSCAVPSTNYLEFDWDDPRAETVVRNAEGEETFVNLPNGAAIRDGNDTSTDIILGTTSGIAVPDGWFRRGISGLTQAGRTWHYDLFVDCQPVIGLGCTVDIPQTKITVSRPDGSSWELRSSTVDYRPSGRPTSQVSALGQTTYFSYQNHGQNRWSRLVKQIRFPEGNKIEFTYDDRGNRVEVKNIGKDGIGEIVNETVYFPQLCLSNKYCNKPSRITDAYNNSTDFEYSTIHGNIIRRTLPSNDDGIRAETRYTYIQAYSWLKSGNTFVQSLFPIWKIATEEFCRTSTADNNGNCTAGAMDKVTTTYEYEQGNSLKGSNLLLKGISITADGTTIRTCYGYDIFGRQVSETQPLGVGATCA